MFLGGTCDIMEYYLERDDILLSQHQAWRPQAIIWTSVELRLLESIPV